LTLTRRSK